MNEADDLLERAHVSYRADDGDVQYTLSRSAEKLPNSHESDYASRRRDFRAWMLTNRARPGRERRCLALAVQMSLFQDGASPAPESPAPEVEYRQGGGASSDRARSGWGASAGCCPLWPWATVKRRTATAARTG